MTKKRKFWLISWGVCIGLTGVCFGFPAILLPLIPFVLLELLRFFATSIERANRQKPEPNIINPSSVHLTKDLETLVTEYNDILSGKTTGFSKNENKPDIRNEEKTDFVDTPIKANEQDNQQPRNTGSIKQEREERRNQELQEREERKKQEEIKRKEEHDEWLSNLIEKRKGNEKVRQEENKNKAQEAKRGRLTTVQGIVKKCATCQLWGGYRKIDEPLRRHVEYYPNDKGRCYAPGTPSGYETNSDHTCSKWTKWSVFK